MLSGAPRRFLNFILEAEIWAHLWGFEGSSVLASFSWEHADIEFSFRFLPIANVAKIMKASIPENAKIAKDAKECVQVGWVGATGRVGCRLRTETGWRRVFGLWALVSGWQSRSFLVIIQECVSEFVSFVTSEASDRCHQEKRKTINGEDLLFAMSTLGFDSYVEPLKIFLSKYRDSIKG